MRSKKVRVSRLALALHDRVLYLRSSAPAGEPMQTPVASDQLLSGPFVEVIGVRQENLGADAAQFVGRDASNSAMGRDGHEGRCRYRSVRQVERSCSGGAERMGTLKG